MNQFTPREKWLALGAAEQIRRMYGDRADLFLPVAEAMEQQARVAMKAGAIGLALVVNGGKPSVAKACIAWHGKGAVA